MTHPVEPSELHTRRSAAWATTTPSNGAGSAGKSRKACCAPHFVRTTVRIHEYPDGRLAIFHGTHRLANCDPRETCAMTPNGLREPLRQPAYGFVDNAPRCPQPHRPLNHRSGQLMRYKERST